MNKTKYKSEKEIAKIALDKNDIIHVTLEQIKNDEIPGMHCLRQECEFWGSCLTDPYGTGDSPTICKCTRTEHGLQDCPVFGCTQCKSKDVLSNGMFGPFRVYRCQDCGGDFVTDYV